MAILGAINKIAKTLDAEVVVNEEGRETVINVEAPKGKVWTATGDIHMLVANWAGSKRQPTWKEERHDALVDLIARMKMGLSNCNDPECDYCSEG